MFRAAFLPIIIGIGAFYTVVMTVYYHEQDGTAVPSCSW
jgi:hypothetical protein